MKPTVIAGFVGILIGAGACEKASEVEVMDLDKEEFPTSADDDPIVKVRGTGSGAKRALRLKPTVGEKQRMTMKLRGDLGPQKMDMTMEMTSEVTRVGANGSFDVVSKLIDADMGATMSGFDADARRMFKDLIKDMGFEWTFTDRGNLERQKITGSMAGMAGQGFGQLFLSLPEERIGVGAKWVVNDVITQNGMTVHQQMRYEVTGFKGTAVDLEMAVSQRVDPKGAPQGIESLKTSGKGDLVIDTARAMPQRMVLDLDMEVKAKGGPSQKMKMSFDWSTK